MVTTDQEILTVKQAAALTPWSASTLYRIARSDPRSPFRKVWGQIVVTREDLIEWVRSAPCPAECEPMPQVDMSVDTMLSLVQSMRKGG